MNPDRRVIVLVLSGLLAWALTASLVRWSPRPKAVVGIAAFVAALTGYLLRPRVSA